MEINLHTTDPFTSRHIGSDPKERREMLATIGLPSIERLISEIIPPHIQTKGELDLPEALTEFQLLADLKKLAAQNQCYKSYIGLGYFNCITPSVILRNIFETPGWYTQYTPYQSEISQGRLEALLNFQTMISDLTGMALANASLLDEATAAAEAMTMTYRLRSRELIKRNANLFFVSETCLPQTIDVLKTRAEPLGIELQIGDPSTFDFNDRAYGVLLQYPDADGQVHDYTDFCVRAGERQILVTVAADLLSLALLKVPGEFGADVVIGSSQRFGVPLGYGGPHAAFFATKEAYKRHIPGRIIGVSQDSYGKPAFRMALQTREQHIRREKATSNICTAQALLAIMAGMYAVYHGPKGIQRIAERVHVFTCLLATSLSRLGFSQKNTSFFDTLKLSVEKSRQGLIREEAEKRKMNFRYFEDGDIGLSIDETVQIEDLNSIVAIFSEAIGAPTPKPIDLKTKTFTQKSLIPVPLSRNSPYLTHPIFNSHHSETQMMRYIKKLENRDLSLTTSMIPLGSCTMKLNAASEMLPISWPEFSQIHPFVPVEQAIGYRKLFHELEHFLSVITGFHAVSLQPNSGAQGEYAGLLVIRAFHKSRGEEHRNIVLIPSSAHGTNPASAVMTGMNVAIVKCDNNGNIDVEDLREKASQSGERLAALMVTYPSTHGVYESKITEICNIVHQYGGQVYMDGANLNAQVGYTNPQLIGADVCHLNLHKTFSIPHGGGGPGIGPIAVAEHLEPFLPKHPLVAVGGDKGIHAVAATPWGSASILVISYAYIKMLGRTGLREATANAMLNANYIKARLQDTFPILYTGENGHVAHELIFDLRQFKETIKVEVEDVAKRLMDYGFHAPTVSFPVPGTMMVEPTESEDKAELDRFCDALLQIREEIREIEDGKADPTDNVLKNAPHTAEKALSGEWSHAYSRQKACYPLPYLYENKFWPPVGRVDNVYGDRNLICACPPLEAYE